MKLILIFFTQFYLQSIYTNILHLYMFTIFLQTKQKQIIDHENNIIRINFTGLTNRRYIQNTLRYDDTFFISPEI